MPFHYGRFSSRSTLSTSLCASVTNENQGRRFGCSPNRTNQVDSQAVATCRNITGSLSACDDQVTSQHTESTTPYPLGTVKPHLLTGKTGLAIDGQLRFLFLHPARLAGNMTFRTLQRFRAQIIQAFNTLFPRQPVNAVEIRFMHITG